jgi:HEPN domain-containing protein
MDKEYIFEWFQFADMDLATAEHLSSTMHPQPLEIICYHCQQAAEKYLKGVLFYHGVIEPPKTHNLNLLMEMCLDYDERFDEIEQACSTLSRYGVQPRYPREIGVTENDTKKALEYARQIRDFDRVAEVLKKIDLI